MTNQELKYVISLSLISGVGHIASKKLIAYCGGAEAIFKEKKSHLLKIPGVGEKVIRSIATFNLFDRAEEEIEYLENNNIKKYYYLNKDYPQRLLHCEDSPILIFSKGNLDLNAKKIIAFVGTRNATVKGKKYCEQIIEELAQHQPTIVSGLAYGIDITAHKAALKNDLSTVGILASGLDDIYPKSHYNTAQEMMKKGGLATDYMSQTKIHPTNFAERNRIVAGLVDAVVVIESSAKGGSLITADLANGYNRDVFAIPGRPDDSQSVGCNRLIKINKAALIESARDIEYILGWEKEEMKRPVQAELFIELNEAEKHVVKLLKNDKSKGLDELSLEAEMPLSKVTGILLNLEFKGVVLSLPGKMYQLS